MKDIVSKAQLIKLSDFLINDLKDNNIYLLPYDIIV